MAIQAEQIKAEQQQKTKQGPPTMSQKIQPTPPSAAAAVASSRPKQPWANISAPDSASLTSNHANAGFWNEPPLTEQNTAAPAPKPTPAPTTTTTAAKPAPKKPSNAQTR